MTYTPGLISGQSKQNALVVMWSASNQHAAGTKTLTGVKIRDATATPDDVRHCRKR